VDIAICMTSYHQKPTDTRCILTHQIIEDAIPSGYAVVIVDGSDDPAIAQSFIDRRAIVHPQQEHGMGHSRREVFARADELWKSIHSMTSQVSFYYV